MDHHRRLESFTDIDELDYYIKRMETAVQDEINAIQEHSLHNSKVRVKHEDDRNLDKEQLLRLISTDLEKAVRFMEGRDRNLHHPQVKTKLKHTALLKLSYLKLNDAKGIIQVL